MRAFQIHEPIGELRAALRQRIDNKTKPLGALGALETLALQIGVIQNSMTPTLRNPSILVFAGDHGIAADGVVNPFPQAVTAQMVLNFLNGGAAINVFCRQHDIALKVVDAGVMTALGVRPGLIDARIAAGTRNYLHEPAMSRDERDRALAQGAAIADEVIAGGCNVLGFGEMGIGNSSSAALLMSVLCGIPVAECVGAGTGLDAAGLARKLAVLEQARARHAVDGNPAEALRCFGGFEIVMMCGAMLQAAERGVLLLIDGFIASAAALAAGTLYPAVRPYCVFTHASAERGHRRMMQQMNASPLLDLGMRLGEGTGAAVAYPLLESAVRFLNEMASFDDAGVSRGA